MARLCEQLDDESSIELRDLWRKKAYGDSAGSRNAEQTSATPAKAKSSAGIMQKPIGNLKSWRLVCRPHPDVAEGRYRQAEFAADLAQVSRGEGSAEYLDPVEFFARTYLKLYDYVKDADKRGVSPGSEALRDMFDECGACLILIDELVAYAKKVYGITGLPAGSFDNLISFIQELTEAARDAICKAFSEMYRNHSCDFPVETKDVSYEQEMIFVWEWYNRTKRKT